MTNTLPASQLEKHQEQFIVQKPGQSGWRLTLAFDDRHGNGHNTFSINCERWRFLRHKKDLVETDRSFETIQRLFPGYEKYLKWHLVSTDGPLHYLANTRYWVEEGNLDYARSTAVWPDATLEELADEEALKARLPALMEEFKADMESLGFTY